MRCGSWIAKVCSMVSCVLVDSGDVDGTPIDCNRVEMSVTNTLLWLMPPVYSANVDGGMSVDSCPSPSCSLRSQDTPLLVLTAVSAPLNHGIAGVERVARVVHEEAAKSVDERVVTVGLFDYRPALIVAGGRRLHYDLRPRGGRPVDARVQAVVDALDRVERPRLRQPPLLIRLRVVPPLNQTGPAAAT